MGGGTALYTDTLKAWAHERLKDAELGVDKVFLVYPAQAEGDGIEVAYVSARKSARTAFLNAKGEILKHRLGWGEPPRSNH